MSSIQLDKINRKKYYVSILVHPSLNNNGADQQIGLCGVFRCKILKLHYANTNSETVAAGRVRIFLKSSILRLRFGSVENSSSTLNPVEAINNNYIQFSAKLVGSKNIEYNIGVITINNFIDVGFFLCKTGLQENAFNYGAVELELEKID